MKSIRLSLLSLVLVAFSASATAQEPEATPEATAFVQERSARVVAIVNGAAADAEQLAAKREELRAAIRGFLSFDVLARRTLGDHWDARAPEEQTQFVELLRDMIETSYCRSLGAGDVGQNQYTVEYTGERSRRDRTTVEATVFVGEDDHLLEVKLESTDAGWIVYDLVTDDVSLEEAYAEMFERIISEDGWESLISRMEERLEELRAEL